MNYGEVQTEWIDYGTVKGWFVVDVDTHEPLEGPFDQLEEAETVAETERWEDLIGGIWE